VGERYYLSSMDSVLLEEPRECWFEKRAQFATGKEAVFAALDPPVQVRREGAWKAVRRVVLTARHEGYGLFPITFFPCFVYVASLVDEDAAVELLTSSELEVIGIGELYRSEKDARAHRFDEQA
jgi:predicted nuclease with RNAse H fold